MPVCGAHCAMQNKLAAKASPTCNAKPCKSFVNHTWLMLWAAHPCDRYNLSFATTSQHATWTVLVRPWLRNMCKKRLQFDWGPADAVQLGSCPAVRL